MGKQQQSGPEHKTGRELALDLINKLYSKGLPKKTMEDMEQVYQPISVEAAYQEFLTLHKLEESQMSTDEQRERRATFYGGYGQCTLHLLTTLSDLPEALAIFITESWLEECNVFWQNQVAVYQADQIAAYKEKLAKGNQN